LKEQNNLTCLVVVRSWSVDGGTLCVWASRRRSCSIQFVSITDVSEVNDCRGWGGGDGEDDDDEDEDEERDCRSIVAVDDEEDFLWWFSGIKDLCWYRLSVMGSVEKIFRRVIGFGDNVSFNRSSFICWQSKLNAERLFNGRIWTTSISSCCSWLIEGSSICTGAVEVMTGVVKRCWVGGRPIGRKLWLCSSSSSSDHSIEPLWYCCSNEWLVNSIQTMS
jgi:hypothetical protein